MKNDLKKMESYLLTAAMKYNDPVQDTGHFALALTMEYWEAYDSLRNTDRYHIFRELYFNSDLRYASEVKKGMRLSVSVPTVCRYRKKFVKTFIYYCNQLDPTYFDDLLKTTRSPA